MIIHVLMPTRSNQFLILDRSTRHPDSMNLAWCQFVKGWNHDSSLKVGTVMCSSVVVCRGLKALMRRDVKINSPSSEWELEFRSLCGKHIKQNAAMRFAELRFHCYAEAMLTQPRWRLLSKKRFLGVQRVFGMLTCGTKAVDGHQVLGRGNHSTGWMQLRV